MAKYSSESEGISVNTDSPENFHVVPSTDTQDSLVRDEEEEQEVEPEITEIEEQVPRSLNPVIVFFTKVIKLMLLPFCKLFLAPTAQRTFVKTTVLALTISYIVATSIFAYVLFYNKYVPPITNVKPFWFHYAATQGPRATVSILAGNSVPLRHNQVYDFSVLLRVPTSDINFRMGNFMIDIQLLTNNGSIITRSSRPAILRYQSRAQRIMRVFTKAVLLLVGLSEESQELNTKLIDNFTELKNKAVNKVEISISDPRIQIYEAKLLIHAKLHGLCYYMYFHRIMTALAFICIFSAIEFIFATIAWKGIGERLWRKLSQSFKYHEHAVVASRSDLLDNVSNKSDSI